MSIWIKIKMQLLQFLNSNCNNLSDCLTLVFYNLCIFCRFSYEGRWKQKLQTSVDFPLDSLDLSQYVIGPKQNLKRYSLYGVSVSRSEMNSIANCLYYPNLTEKVKRK